jgi:drug/metabolite transporter (DMT)-like permease
MTAPRARANVSAGPPPWRPGGVSARAILRVAPVGVVLRVILSLVFVLETFGITRTSATNAGLIISLTLVMTPLVARSRVPPTFYVAAMLATLGVALLTQGNGINAPSLGDLLMLLPPWHARCTSRRCIACRQTSRSTLAG